ncbi:MAG: zinc ribbon domain-containing protein [Deltaproteobacteria bacterium]|nr:MAG: zinc ribbon domain-containing protein [Deltaproteobacteria bacterium]
MPIYEFRCIRCGQVFEKLFMSKDEEVDITCPYCKSEVVERVVSTTNYVVGLPEGAKKPKITQRSCAGGSCMTVDLPGYTKD